MQDLNRQLKSLNKIQPSTEWKNSTREDILAQIMGENTPTKLSFWAEFLYLIKFSSGFFHDFIMRPVGTFALIVILVSGGGILKVKADGSLPGDLLYSLKRGGEKTQIAFMFNEDKKSDLQLELLNKRVRELNRIALKGDTYNQEKMKKALENFHKDFTPIKENLTLMGDDSEKALKIAIKVEDTTSEMHFILNKTQNKNDERAKIGIEKAINEISKTNFDALEVIVKEDENKEIGEISQKIDEKIEEVSEKAEEAGGEALAKLEEAKEDLINMQFVAALQKVKESQEIINKDENSTSTIDIITEEATEEATTTDLFLNNNENGQVKGESTSTVWSVNTTEATSTEDMEISTSTEE